MSAPLRPCALEDLKAYLEAAECWTVDKNGNPAEFEDIKFSPGKVWYVLEYWCLNCDTFFTPSRAVDDVAIDKARQRALAHLGGRAAA